MPTQPDKPGDVLTQIDGFLDRYEDVLIHHANFLDAVEQSAEERRRLTPHDPDLAAPELYSRQAKYLRDLIDIFADALTNDAPPLAKTAEQRMELQEAFAHAIGTIRLIIDEHQDMHDRMERKADPGRLEKQYRRKYSIAEDEVLDADAARRINRRSRFYRREVRDMGDELRVLSGMETELNGLRNRIIHGRPDVGGKIGGETP